jgi:teichuronic acid biosynthesis glycosyltransferase TuaH
VKNTNTPVLLWMAGQPWRLDAGTDRSMATAMTRYARVLWVDPPYSPVTRGVYSGAGALPVRPVLTEVDDRIVRLSTVALPGMTRAIVRDTTPALTRVQIRWALRRLGVRPFAAVTCYLSNLLGYWGEDVVNVMYGTDDYVAGAELMGLSASHLRAQEERCLSRADVVLAISPELSARWINLGAKPVVVRNGCWPEGPISGEAPAEIARLPRPVVGLAGYLSDRIDIDVLEAIVDSGMSLLIAGERDPRWETERFNELTARANVFYAGNVRREKLRSYLSSVDVGITPYKDSQFNRASFPLKTLEYLGFGIPAVTANLPSAQWLLGELCKDVSDSAAGQMLALAEGPAKYVPAIRRVLDEKRSPRGDERAKRCVAFAEMHSWYRRAEVFAGAIGLLRQ